MSWLKDIYFFDARGLAEKFRAGEVAEYQIVKHLLAVLILGGISFGIPVSLDVVVDRSLSRDEFFLDLIRRFFSSTVQFLIHGLIVFYGVLKIYRANCSGDAKDFIPRLVALTLPVGVQLAVGFTLFLLAFALVIPVLAGRGEATLRMAQVVPYVAILMFYLMFFGRLRYYVGIAAGREDAS